MKLKIVGGIAILFLFASISAGRPLGAITKPFVVLAVVQYPLDG